MLFAGGVMKIGDILLLVGLGLGLIAGILLAYDAIHGAGARFKAQVAATQLESYRAFRADLQKSIRRLGGSYNDKDKQDLLAKEEKDHAPQEKILIELASSIPDDYEDKVVVIALRGIWLLIASFAFQLIGTLMDALRMGGHL
jgi:hypothetical protein